MEVFSPKLGLLKKHSVNRFIYFFWFVLTLGKYKIIYLYDNDKIIHYTHLLPKFFKFPFMKSDDLEIGPSWTAIEFRGKGLFPSVIAYILEHFKKGHRDFHILVHDDNISSQKAIQKVDFQEWGRGYRTKFLGIYKVENV
ncbi:MAG: Unknown protein [uncultured Sulfurovum sp.]|uniref:N-acetyltransferase domain-containing protein n=1 Tax=uncultured Sulfurovum sp. TaxID=269237 RepID=A0A6S6SQT6_9BACT|nr:MAG: Unknown protein [uncultured Sulfurovum sp.]CAA6819292.1 MAG: Unknown protein [uncultured Sulfurovum sp.]